MRRSTDRSYRAVLAGSVLAALAVLMLAVGAVVQFNAAVDRIDREAQQRKQAFCGLAFLFDESIRLRGSTDLGPLQAPYDEWKSDIDVLSCAQYQEDQ